MIIAKNRISLGNKAIGIISFISVMLMAVIFAALGFIYSEFYLTGVSFFMILFYSFQANKIAYIEIDNGNFIIENVFKKSIVKSLDKCRRVEKIGFINLMQIEFSDNTKYIFWGESERIIRERIQKLS